MPLPPSAGTISPRVVERAGQLATAPTVLRVVLAPLYCVGYFAATRRVMLVSWIGTFAIILLIILVHRLDQPWRGIVDAGVVVGLTWGQISLALLGLRYLRNETWSESPQLPG